MKNINADIGLIGLGVMGSSLALNMESNGYTVAVHNRTAPQIDNIVNNRSKHKKIFGFENLEKLVNSIKTPRKIMLMVVAGTVVDDYIQKLIPLLDQGDIIIDGGNSHFPDTPSVKITLPSVIVSIAIASVNGYALANWRFKGANLFFTILIFGAFIPYQIMIYPLVILLRDLGIYTKLPGLILIHSIFGMPILTLLFRNYFTTIPEELFKAARVDGARFWGIYFRVMMPMSLPIFVVAIIMQVTGIWNDFLFGVIYTKPDTYPMTVQLNNIVNSVQGVKEYNVNMAATLLTGLVPLTIYFISGKLFVRGIAAGAVKG